MWIYIKTEPQLWTVGFYDPNNKFRLDSDHSNREKAAERCAFLNGNNYYLPELLGKITITIKFLPGTEIKDACKQLQKLATKLGVFVEGQFNEITLRASPQGSTTKLLKEYSQLFNSDCKIKIAFS